MFSLETNSDVLGRLGFRGVTVRPGGYVKARHRNGKVVYLPGSLASVAAGEDVAVARRVAESAVPSGLVLSQDLRDVDRQIRTVAARPTRSGANDARGLLQRRAHLCSLLERHGVRPWPFLMSLDWLFEVEEVSA